MSALSDRPRTFQAVVAILVQAGQEAMMRPYVKVTGMALGLVAMWATLVQLLA
jgi:hypothetical protein